MSKFIKVALFMLMAMPLLGLSWPADKFPNGIPKIGDKIITFGPSSSYCIGIVVSVNLTFVEMKDACERSMQFVDEDNLTAPGKILKWRWKYIDSWRLVRPSDITIWKKVPASQEYIDAHGSTIKIERIK